MTDRRSFLAAMGSALISAHPAAALFSSACSPADGAAPPATGAPRALLDALVLGTVQDAGLPQVGCYTPRCEIGRTLPQPRFVSSIALVEPEAERFYLVDATPDITRQIDLIQHPAFRARAAERRPFDGIFLTHAHIGHYLGLALLGNEGMGISDTPVYCTPLMGDFLRTNAPWSLMVEQGRIIPTPHRAGDGRGRTIAAPLARDHREPLRPCSEGPPQGRVRGHGRMDLPRPGGEPPLPARHRPVD